MAARSTSEAVPRFKPPMWAVVIGLVFLVGYPIGLIARGFAPLMPGVFVGAIILFLLAYGIGWTVYRIGGRSNRGGGIAFGALACLLLVMGVLNISDAMGFREARAKALELQNRSAQTTNNVTTQRKTPEQRLDEFRQAEQERMQQIASATDRESAAQPEPEPPAHPEWRALGVQFANDIALTTRTGEFENRQDRERLERLEPAEAALVRARIALREYILETNARRDEAWDAVGNGGIVTVANVVNETDPARIEAMRERFRTWSRAAAESVAAYDPRDSIGTLLGEVDGARRDAFFEGLDAQIEALNLSGKVVGRQRAAEKAIEFIDFLEENTESIRIRDRRVSITDPALETPLQEHAALARSAMRRCSPWDRIRRSP